MADGTARIITNLHEFVAYVERRVGDRALAEDIVHDALVRRR
jgi:DNA-directed RNA polymerase specialized sigma24 family protein